jgi:hypothetical protein
MSLVARIQELQASRRENQWHPRVQIPVKHRAPYHFHAPDGIRPTVRMVTKVTRWYIELPVRDVSFGWPQHFKHLLFPVRQAGGGIVRGHASWAFRVWTEFTVPTGMREWTSERNAIGHTHGSASSVAKAPMALIESKFLSTTVHRTQHESLLVGHC